MAYAKRFTGGFIDLPNETTPVDQTFLNAVEAALLALFSVDPSASQVPAWDGTKYVPRLLANANIDPAAAIDKSKLGPLSIVDADVAGGAAIAKSKLALGASLTQADMAPGNKVTRSTLAGGPPAGPNDGDVWIATNCDPNNSGVTWAFSYDASQPTYKWVFIGGGEIELQQSWGTSGAPGVAFLDTAGYYISVPRSGEYRAFLDGYIDSNTLNNNTVLAIIGQNGNNVRTVAYMGLLSANWTGRFGFGGGSRVTANAGDHIQIGKDNGNRDTTYSYRLSLVPVRIS